MVKSITNVHTSKPQAYLATRSIPRPPDPRITILLAVSVLPTLMSTLPPGLTPPSHRVPGTVGSFPLTLLSTLLHSC